MRHPVSSNVFAARESNVRSYCRTFPVVFSEASNATMVAEDGRSYIDFFCGAGALNYGHNNPYIKQQAIDYLAGEGVLHSLDMHTPAKRHFLETFIEEVLEPKGLDYKVQFPGPTGTNAVEAALKIARRVKGRPLVLAFAGGFHGMSLGALAVTSNRDSRQAAGVPLNFSTFLPYPTSETEIQESLAAFELALTDTHSGVDKPAAVIVETVQAEGGINPAQTDWLRALRQGCDEHDVLLIVDDIQVGCHRTGPFFSFETAGIVPDIVTLSKSISGIGFPMSLVLLKPELDIWSPGEHTGTFRGNQLAFVTAAAGLRYAREAAIEEKVQEDSQFVARFLEEEVASLDERIDVRGRGMIWGVDLSRCGDAAFARRVANDCFADGLVIERAGRDDTVLKLLPPLTIGRHQLETGCGIIRQSVKKALLAA
jgi:diaminobutyrate-2-oxoglutarate transaminase